MVLVIDTSSALAGLAVVLPGAEVGAERVLEAGRNLDLAGEVEAMISPADLSAVAVALGPGSFTGLRMGAAFGVGLALGLRIPLLGLDTLAICRARSLEPSRGVSEAGRGRVYHAAEGGEPGLGEPEQVPVDLSLAGWLRPATAEAFAAAGHTLLPESRMRSFGVAAASLLGRAPEVGYGSVRVRYMQPDGVSN